MGTNSNARSSKSESLKSPKKDVDSTFITPSVSETNSRNSKAKSLSPEFNNINDEAELGKMMGDNGEKLLTLIDDILKIDSIRKEELNIPQVLLVPTKFNSVTDLNSEIVVIGGTSTGKSSVLQAFTRLPFPVSDDICTRFVTETTVRRCGPYERPGYTIEVKLDGVNTPQAPQFAPKTFEADDWIEVYQKLRDEIAESYDEMNLVHLLPHGVPEKGKEWNSSTGPRPPPVPQLSRHRMQITVRTRNQAHFSIVDIPGFISSKPPK